MHMGIQYNQRTLQSLQLYEVSHFNTLNICNLILTTGPHTTTLASLASTTTTVMGTPTDSRPSSK